MIIQKIVIAGAGTMGSSMAQIYAEYFDDVVLYNHRQETLGAGEGADRKQCGNTCGNANLTKEKAKQSAWCIVLYHFYGMLQKPVILECRESL